MAAETRTDQLDPGARDDRVLGMTRVLGAVIAPFLVGAFVLLYPEPAETGRVFAWPVRPTMTPMVLASAYLGGTWFFVRLQRERRWAALRAGLVAVTLFATLLGVATLVHWDRFTHDRPAFWVWATLYLLAPPVVVAVWVANARTTALAGADEPRLGAVARWSVAAAGLLALVTGAALFVAPTALAQVWPWALTPLTARVVGAVFCLGAAGLVTVVDDRVVAVRALVEVAVVMLVAIALAAVRARGEMHAERPLTWLLAVGLLCATAGSAWLWRTTPRGTDAGLA